MSKDNPTASERTVSLYTGKTDLEDPNARDGSRALVPSRRGPARQRLRWYGTIDEWYTFDRKDDHEYEIVKKGDQYHARRYSERIGSYDSILLAGDACEEWRDKIGGPRKVMR